MRRASLGPIILLLSLATLGPYILPAHAYSIIDVFPGSHIQAAIDSAAAGDIVAVHSGTYQEQLSIAKPVTVEAASGSTVIVQSPSAASRSPAFTVVGSSQFWDPVVRIHDTSNAGIIGLVVDGDSQGVQPNQFVGVLIYQASSAYVLNSEVKNVYLTIGFSGVQTGVGIAVFPGATTASALLQNNNIHAYNKKGITVNGMGASATINANIVTGAGATPLIAQNGIQISRGATGRVVFNTVSFTGPYTGPSSAVSVGILIFESKGFSTGKLQQNNQLSNNQFDVIVIPS